MIGRNKYTIEAYIGYTTANSSLIKGRVLRCADIIVSKSDGWWTNLRNSIRRFTCRKAKSQQIILTKDNKEYHSITDDDGYFAFSLSESYLSDTNDPVEIQLSLPGHDKVTSRLIKIDTDYIVVSDIDDTIIKTQVSSVLKLKLLFNTIFKNHYQRTAIKGMAEIYHKLEKYHLANFFYISKSPNNLYSYIVDFLSYNGFPLGVIILRDFGWHLLSKKSAFGEKYEELNKLYTIFSDKKFILVGDAAEKDADIYYDLAQKYPDQTKGIFIRKLEQTKNLDRIEKTLMSTSETPVFLFEDYDSLDSALRSVMHVES